MRRGSLALRIFGGFGLVILLTLAVAGVVFFSLLGGYRDAIDRDSIQQVADQVYFDVLRQAQRTVVVRDFIDYLEAQAEETGAIVLILDDRGRVLDFSPTPTYRDAVLPVTFRDVQRQGGALNWVGVTYNGDDGDRIFLTRIFPIDTFVSRRALVAISVEDSNAADVVSDLLPRLLFSGLAGLAVALLVAYIVSSSLYRPLRRITGAVSAFGRGRYDTRVPETGPNEARDLAAAFNRMAGQVEANERTMQEFMADVSHELRTPLTSIRGFTQALTDGTVEDPEQQQRSVQVIDDEARRMLRLVEQLLDLSRMEAGELRLRREAVDVRELTHHVADVFEQRAEESGLTLTVTVDEDAPAIIGDYDRLVQVLTNLVANAVQHTTAGSVALTAVADRGGGVLLGVSDTGAGIAPEHLPRLFDRFYRAADGGPRRGTGLGLAISREIVRAHGGEIWAESLVSEGTSVRLRLPLHPPDGESSTQREADSSPEPDGPAC